MIDHTDCVMRSGRCQHFVRELGNPESRLVYRGELMAVRR